MRQDRRAGGIGQAMRQVQVVSEGEVICHGNDVPVLPKRRKGSVGISDGPASRRGARPVNPVGRGAFRRRR
jgi:hypothetical protein